MKVDFERLHWVDYPSEETPINADNLNRLEEGVAGLYSDLSDIDNLYKKVGSVFYYFPNLSTGGYSGNCSLAVTRTKTVLFDCGPTSDWNAIKLYFDNLYNSGLFTNIDYIVISHYHYDHIQNLDSLLKNYPHENCHAYVPLNPASYSSTDVSGNYNSVISALTANGVEYTEVSSETTIVIDEAFTEMTLFNSSVEDYTYYKRISAVYNNYSMVALIKSGNVYSMFPGDIQREAQIRIVNTRKLPRLFLYCVHHHGIQNDDYRPYLEAIDPEYSVIMTSHNRALVSAASSFSGNYFSGDVGSTGFSSYAYVSGKDGGSIIEGAPVPKIGWYYTYVTLYVDNSYSGEIYDGTEEHPFTNINEAIMFVNKSSNLHYIITVKGTSEKYEYTWIRDMFVPLEIIGKKGSNNEYPSVSGIYMRNCTNVSISNMTIDGTGRTVNNQATLIYAWAAQSCSFSNCVIDGANMENAGSTYSFQLRESHLYITGCEIKNVSTGFLPYREGSVTTNGVNFKNLATACYSVGNLSVTIKGKDTVTNCAKWVIGNLDSGRPFVVAKNAISNSLLALNSASAVSVPFYYDSNNPVCVCQGTKVYNILTGAAVTIS